MRLHIPVLLVLLAAMPAFAQHEHGAAAPAPAVAMDSGLSDLHWAVTTSNADAQRFFDQGMRYTYAFNHDMAIQSFRHATELDPSLAMGYWGIALALGPNINLDVDPDREKQAYDAVQSALGHLPAASAKERDLVNALAKRYTNDPAADLHALAEIYSHAMGEVAARYPDDPDVATLYAESLMDLRPWKFWSHDGKPAEGTEEIVRVLESVLARHPNHLGANHYYIHAIEASSHPERAIASAHRLQTLAPAAGHLVHMPAHILQRTGDYAGAAQANENGARADREFMKQHGAEGIYPLMYYNHNLQFGAAAYAMEGNLAAARTMAEEMANNAAPIAKEMPMIESVVATPILMQLRFGRWTDVIATPLHDGAGPLGTTLWHFARGVAFARLGNVLGAQSEQKELEAARAAVPDDPAMFQNSQKKIADIAARVLNARIEEAGGNTAAAIADYDAAVALEDALNYDEPADWFYPVRETLGAALLRDGRYADAAHVFEADLQHNPHNPRSLWGLAAARRGANKDAAQTTAEYRRRWKGAPLTLANF
jgi:tetratricopeptide (TPR) repeat protein